MASQADPLVRETHAAQLTCVCHRTLDAVAAEWDALVPHDFPHLRAGFLHAAEHSGVAKNPAYILAHQDGRPVAAALAYDLLYDTVRTAPEGCRNFVARVRKIHPRFLWRTLRICGSPVSNAESGVWFDPALPAERRREVFTRLIQEVMRTARLTQAIYIKEFTPDAVAGYAGELEKRGFFSAEGGAGTRLELRWGSYEQYVAAMRKHYRKLVRKDEKMSEGIEFQLLDSFADLAPTAFALYEQVYARAEYVVEKLNAAFFAAISDFDQAKLLVARERASGEVVGMNLLLFGDTVMQNLFIGFDYTRNERHHLYFNLVEQSLRAALERGCKTVYLGQDSYPFKARLGAKPFPLTLYMRHRVPPVHWFLRSMRHQMFPSNEAVEHDVFQEGPGGKE